MPKKARVFFIAAILCATTVAAQEPYPLNPSERPLVVIRADKASIPARLLETRQLQALGLNGRDFSGTLPGLDLRVTSLKSFIAYLEAAEANTVWYCIAQRGGSLARQTGGMGWHAPLPGGADRTGIAAELAAAGLDTGRGVLDVRAFSTGESGVSVLRDAEVGKILFAKEKQKSVPWGESLEYFLSASPDGLGIWLNTRPLMGAATLLSGIDLRALLAERHLAAPEHASLALLANDGDLGVVVRLDNLFSGSRWDKFFPTGRSVRSHPTPLLDLNITSPELFLAMFDPNRTALALANINLDLLLPESINLAVWRGEGGALRWHAVCLLSNPDGENQYRRIERLLECLAASGALSLEKVPAPDGTQALRIRSGGLSLVTMAAKYSEHSSVPENSFYILAGDVEDLPLPEKLTVRSNDDDFIMSWELRPDAAARSEVISLLADLARSHGESKYDMEFFEAFLPEADSGHMEDDWGTLAVSSRSGLTPLVLPAIAQMVKMVIPPGAPARERLVLKRLRYLLDVASQSRFRDVDPLAGEARAWPDQWRDVLGANGEARRWLDTVFDDFPSEHRPTSAVIAALTEGGAVGGDAYTIVRTADSWSIVAEVGGEERFSLDAKGVMRRKEGSDWVEYTEGITDLW